MWRLTLPSHEKIIMSSKSIAFEVIENSGPNNLRDALKAKLGKASQVRIAAAFVTQSGLDEIIQALRQVATQGKVRIITGLYQCVTEPRALKSLLSIQMETHGNFSVRLSREPQFHRKVFLLENRTQATAIVGSSNLTKEGLRSGGELNLMVSLLKSGPIHMRLKEAFEKDWKGQRSVPLTAEQVERYENTRLAPVGQKNYTNGQLKKILGAEPTHEKATVNDEPINFWQECITGTVKKRTERLITETTNWDDKGYKWFATCGPHKYRIDSRIFYSILWMSSSNLLR
jgi:HKD family nuclease